MSHIENLYLGMLTKNYEHIGPDSPIVLIVDENGKDMLHLNITDTPQSDFKNGAANLYHINVKNKNIERGMLNNSSVRVGIRGVDHWSPEHIVIWGDHNNEKEIIPVAMETNLKTRLSTDSKEGALSIPVMLVNKGTDSTMINRILIMIRTSEAPVDGTNSRIELQIATRSKQVLNFECLTSSQLEQERYRACMYFVKCQEAFAKRDLFGKSFTLTISGNDKWLPKSFFIFGIDTVVGNPTKLVPLVYVPIWNLGWMSTNKTEGKSMIELPVKRELMVEMVH